MNISVSNIVAYIFLGINPILSFIYSIILVINGRSKLLLPAAISICIVYTYFPVLWDFRNNFFSIFVYNDARGGLYNDIYNSLFYYFNINYITMVLIYAVLISYLWYTVFNINNKCCTNSLITLIIFLMFFEYRYIMDLQRTTLALVIAFCGYFYFLNYKKYIFYIIAICIHPFSLFILCFDFLKIRIVSWNKQIFIIIFALIVGVLFKPFLLLILNSFSNDLSLRVYNYLLVDKNIYSSDIVMYFVYVVRFVYLIVILYVYKSSSGSRLHKIFFFSVVCGVLFITNDIIFERLYMIMTFSSYLIMVKYKISNKKVIIALLLGMFNYSMNNINTLRIVFSDKYQYVIPDSEFKYNMAMKVLYYSTPMLLLYEDNGYSNKTILNEVQ